MKNALVSTSLLLALGATGCMSQSSGSATEAILVCEGFAEDGAACMVSPDGDVCATAQNAQGTLCDCVPVDGSRTGAWDCFPAEPVDITCRGVVDGELCTDDVLRCVNAYEGFDVVCECYAPPGSRRALAWRCDVVPTADCDGPACSETDPSGPAGACPEGADCAPSDPGAACPEGADCAPSDPGAACPEGADCAPPSDDCPGAADCGPASEECDRASGCTEPGPATCATRESALRECRAQYETCLDGPPSFISCDDQLERCIGNAPGCPETR